MKTVGVFGIVLLAVLSQGDCIPSHALENRALTDGTAEYPVEILQTLVLGLIAALFGHGTFAGLPDFTNIFKYWATTLFSNGIVGVNPIIIVGTLFSLFTMEELAINTFDGFTTVFGAIFEALGVLATA